MAESWSACTLPLYHMLPGGDGTCPPGEDGGTQASLAPAEGVQSASYHPCQESRTESYFQLGLNMTRCFHRRQCQRILGMSLALVWMLWLLIFVLTVMCVCPRVCVYVCVACPFPGSLLCVSIHQTGRAPMHFGWDCGRAGLGGPRGFRPCVLLLSALGWQGGRLLCWDPLSQLEVPQTPRHYSLKGGVWKVTWFNFFYSLRMKMRLWERQWPVKGTSKWQ